MLFDSFNIFPSDLVCLTRSEPGARHVRVTFAQHTQRTSKIHETHLPLLLNHGRVIILFIIRGTD